MHLPASTSDPRCGTDAGQDGHLPPLSERPGFPAWAESWATLRQVDDFLCSFLVLGEMLEIFPEIDLNFLENWDFESFQKLLVNLALNYFRP